MSYIIGIDSGGTHITGEALSMTGDVLHKEESGPGNIFLNYDSTITNLTDVIGRLLEKMQPQICEYVVMGVAGIETTGTAVQVSQFFTEKFQVPVKVISDAQLALLNGLEGHDGTLVIAGTGSVVYGRQNKRLLRYGGWGFLLGDTGSAYKITEAAVKYALYLQDSNKQNDFIPFIQKIFQVESLTAVVQKYYHLDRTSIASLSKSIGEKAAAGSMEATQIITNQAIALATEVLGLLKQYQKPCPKRLALSGSVLTNNDSYRNTLVTTIQTHYPELEIHTVATNNSHGAIYWSRWEK
ncbi:BadF/BadG/BcrA/BcrD ATPase family protein [Enterococcus asini]|uniref:N-acetylglucosamine kinase n=1 Tax=Enterococcus asini TaxID=57732 RepID=UPI00288E6EAC|nr:BadF/BadG/BcrA/BcrD ATPase family protein [Enterococcus asini]MDT2757670.1 BadF/BadG/BcrA/BcrD ATPase family protein [Enterococcus asini]